MEKIVLLCGAITFALVTVVLVVWYLISRRAFGRPCCPQCASERIRRSDFRDAFDPVMKLVAMVPFRCGGCGHRFYSFAWQRRAIRPGQPENG